MKKIVIIVILLLITQVAESQQATSQKAESSKKATSSVSIFEAIKELGAINEAIDAGIHEAVAEKGGRVIKIETITKMPFSVEGVFLMCDRFEWLLYVRPMNPIWFAIISSAKLLP